jgi:hypothetical protein
VPQFFHRDVLKRETYRPKDLLRYISPTYGKPYHILVQAAPNAQPPGEWRRRAVTGNSPWLLTVSAWAIGLKDDGIDNIALLVGKSILVVPVIMFLVAYPMGGAINSSPMYPNFPSRCYEYPKHALNQLDAAPRTTPRKEYGVNDGENFDKDKLYTVDGEQKRLLRPRALRVFQNGQWITVEDGSYHGLYIFISFARGQYVVPMPTAANPNNMVIDKQRLDFRAQRLCEHLGVEAYWCDYHCRAEHQPDATDDVHRFCDVVRGAHQICVVLPDASPNALVFFGQRLWCLPEILLSRNHKVMLCTPASRPGHTDNTELVDIMEMCHRSWCLKLENDQIVPDRENEENFRLLAEHYTGTLILSRLELIQCALTAMKSREWKEKLLEKQRGDIAYVLMTLLSKRPRMDPTDSDDQALARLSLANDSDRIVERMVCMDQIKRPGSMGWFNISDHLGANLWDIEPLCQVAGVCYDGSIILDGCHGISIRWKDIPRIYFLNRETWKKAWAGMSLRSGPFWFLLGIISVSYRLTGPGAFFLFVGIVLLIMSPWSVTTLYGGKVWGAKPWLIGFEGTLPIDEVERLTFGNSIGRFTYTPSSGPYCSRRLDERVGTDPSPNLGKLPQGYRLFTLIDTVSLLP